MCLASALTGVVVVIYSFAGYIPKYRCRIPYCDGPNATYFDQNGEFPPHVIQGIQSVKNRIKHDEVLKGIRSHIFFRLFIVGLTFLLIF